jgi:hypothetical protein
MKILGYSIKRCAGINDLARDRRGGVMVEFAFMLPIITSLVLGGVEFARYAQINQKMDRVAGFVGDLIARAKSLEAADFVDYFAAAEQLANPYDLMAGGTIIVSSVTGEPGGAQVLWQQIGPGAVTETSRVGAPGGPATLPSGFVLGEEENIVITEVFFDFEPLFMPPAFVEGGRLYYRSVFRPRTTAVLAMEQE